MSPTLPRPPAPFVLLDDARTTGAQPARLYRDPVEIVAAHRLDQVLPALARLEALSAAGHHLAGHLAYEAGLALEPRLAPLAQGRIGADGPLLWFGAFAAHETIPAAEIPAWLASHATATPRLGPLTPQVSQGAHAQAFAAIHAAIHAGDIYQANLTLPLAGPWSGDPLALYQSLRQTAAAGHGGLVFTGAHWLLSFSPELFFSLKSGEILVRPMKGTRPRTPGVEDNAAAELAASPKDRAENLMIVDLMRNDLARVAQPGSVRVESPFAIESYPTVHQMVSTVRARLQPGLGAVDVLKALFPCGSITGAPKIRAMELIAANEPHPRGPYCGAIGRIDSALDGSGDAAFNVAIRTLRLTPDPHGGGKATIGVGSAVVADSEARSEWRECMVKGAFLRQSATAPSAPLSPQPAGAPPAALFDLIETMAFTPEQGIPLLDLHLARLSASARELGFAHDRHAVRNAIQALCFEAEAPSRLRLTVSRSGAYALEIGAMPAPLPDPLPCILLPHPLDASDTRLAHKTSDRAFYEAGLAAAKAHDAAEALLVRDDGLVTEGCFTNLFVERDGMLLTPPARLGLLPGVLRRSLIDSGRAREADLTIADLAAGFRVGNALRGLMKAQLL